MNRRRFLGLAGSALALSHPVRALAQGARAAVVETSSGRIRGLGLDGVQIFKGVPYGAPTGGAARFMRPSKPQPWTGTREALTYGPRCWQPTRPMIAAIGDALTGSGPMGEDCLTLNVWMPSATPNAGRPVMVWFHGGGQRTGSGNSSFYDGTELARKHDVVVVTVNHRLNAFGNLYLAEVLGGKYAETSNLGLLDLVQALEWVRDNIAAFGGSARNVTIFGQSGGGGKTALLHAMPTAKGLFHKAIIMSTLVETAITAAEPDEGSEAAEMFLSRLGITKANADRLQHVTPEEILSALTGGTGRAGGQAGVAPAAGDLSLRIVPVKDGRTVIVHPFEPKASELAADIPLMCGSNETEGVPYGNPEDDFWKGEVGDEPALRERVKRLLRIDDGEAERLIALYRKGHPNESPADLALIMTGDNSPLRLSAYTIAERKVAQGNAPVYMYFFKWRSPAMNGKLRSMHTMELPFVFDHADDLPLMTGTGKDRHTLAHNMAESWATFARTGNPSHRGLPNWPAFTLADRATMVFDTESKVMNDPWGEQRRAMQAMRARAAAAK